MTPTPEHRAKKVVKENEHCTSLESAIAAAIRDAVEDMLSAVQKRATDFSEDEPGSCTRQYAGNIFWDWANIQKRNLEASDDNS